MVARHEKYHRETLRCHYRILAARLPVPVGPILLVASGRNVARNVERKQCTDGRRLPVRDVGVPGRWVDH